MWTVASGYGFLRCGSLGLDAGQLDLDGVYHGGLVADSETAVLFGPVYGEWVGGSHAAFFRFLAFFAFGQGANPIGRLLEESA